MPRTSKPAFYDDLVYYLKATTLDEEIIKKLDNFDFRKTARYAFVHTMSVTLSTQHKLSTNDTIVEDPTVMQPGSVLDTVDLVVL